MHQWLFFALVQSSCAIFVELQTEAEALERLKSDKAQAARCDHEEVATFIKRGWWSLSREMVLASHGSPEFGSLEKVVRRELTQIKQSLGIEQLSGFPQHQIRSSMVITRGFESSRRED
eukprot:g1099.t1